MKKKFWENKKLSELTNKEWEALCDGCGKCCLIKLEDIEDSNIDFTNVACHLLDSYTCKCTKYSRRKQLVKDCIQLTPRNIDQLRWMPSTCAYKLLAEGKKLPTWHYLNSNDKNSVHDSQNSVRGRTIREGPDIDLEDFIVSWPK